MSKYSLPHICSQVLCRGALEGWEASRPEDPGHGLSPDCTDWEHILGTEEPVPRLSNQDQSGLEQGLSEGHCWEPEQSKLNTTPMYRGLEVKSFLTGGLWVGKFGS